jgi:histidyl-tRNA synthetase
MERLAILLAQAEAVPAEAPGVYVVSRGELAEPMALQISRQLRQVGYAVELDLSGAAFGKQFKRADRAGARWAVVIGDDEALQGLVVLRDLRAVEEAEAEQRLSVSQLLVRLAQVA